MSSTAAATAKRIDPKDDPYYPHMVVVRAVEVEAPRVATFQVEFPEPGRNQSFAYRPGQFNMIYVPGVGEVAISISGAPGYERGLAAYSPIRRPGDRRPGHHAEGRCPGIARAIRERLADRIGRRPRRCAGRRRAGTGPLRPAVKAILAARERFGRLTLLYGSRQPADLLYVKEFDEWQDRGMDVIVTVDRAMADWRGHVGVVPVLFRTLTLDPPRTVVMTCGPDIMMRFTVAEALGRGIADTDIHVSLERNMQCAVGLCGHCQLGPEFLCMDGPVFSYRKVARFLGKEHF